MTTLYTPENPMLKVYTASKLNKRQLWGRLAEEWAQYGIKLHARWYNQVDSGLEETPSNAKVFWQEDAEDVARADAVLVYGVKGDNLRGALVEAGMALALGIPVIVVGGFNYGTWVYHPDIVLVRDLPAALDYLRGLQLRRLREARYWMYPWCASVF